MTRRPAGARLAPKELDEREREIAGAAPGAEPLNIMATLAHNEQVFKRFNRFAGGLLYRGVLPEREREIVILRVGWNCRAVYEFGQHTLIGRRAGLTDDEIRRLCLPLADSGFVGDDADLVAMADELCSDDCVGDETWARLEKRWDPAALVELVVVAGNYRLVSGFLNTMGVELDDGVPGWPDGIEP
ncbi:MAG: carboxymuconolactone decarboxylase family protein [Actinomycetota bacterium]|nr:carboxymuconolactone decarboxylase family protein [Actinomycetota bacterium]